MALSLVGCDERSEGEKANVSLRELSANLQAKKRADTARADATGQLSGSTYQDHFGTSDCNDDCSGHEAGFAWAQENDVTDPEYCGGKSRSFVEGCQAFAQLHTAAVAEALE